MLISSELVQKAIEQGKTIEELAKMIEEKELEDLRRAKENEKEELTYTLRDMFASYDPGCLTDNEVIVVILDVTKEWLKEYRDENS